MSLRATALPIAIPTAHAESALPLYRQLYFALREAILAGRLAPGTRLPATRALAEELKMSRNTVLAAFDQLVAEGYIESRVGAGSYVSDRLPEDLLNAADRDRVPAPRSFDPARLSRRASNLEAPPPSPPVAPAPFSPGVPELSLFPFEAWARLLAKRWRRPPYSLVLRDDPAGYRPLREAIALYLGAARAVSCTADQILIVSGAQQAVDLTARVLLDPGDAVWVEEPGYPGTWGALHAAGAEVVAVPLDDAGFDVMAARASGRSARLVCVSPSHQYPLGITMPVSRRLALLEWARAADAFVIEDDYDSEYRYAGRPLAALQGLDQDGRVIYVGTMSKVMFPALRLGYLVVPHALVDVFRSTRAAVDAYPSTVAQAALADFISEGHLGAHIRRMRGIYERRQGALVDAIERHLSGVLAVAPDEAGMHLVGRLPANVDDAACAQQAATEGIDAPAPFHILSRPGGGARAAPWICRVFRGGNRTCGTDPGPSPRRRTPADRGARFLNASHP